MKHLNKENVMGMAYTFADQVTKGSGKAGRKIGKALWIVLLVTLLSTAGLVYAVIKLDRDGIECMANPLVYGANNYAEQINGTVNCQCSMVDDQNRQSFITFNQDGKTMPPLE